MSPASVSWVICTIYWRRAAISAGAQERTRFRVFAGARALAEAGHFPGGTRRNLEAAQGYVRFDDTVSEQTRLILADAQTSGGLLLAVPPNRLEQLTSALRATGELAALIGEVRGGSPGHLEVR